MTKTIGIIGTGLIGSALGRLAVAAGLDVVLSNSRGPASLADLVAELGEHARAATPAETAQAGDLVVATIPLGAYAQLPAATLTGKIVIDTMNYYPQRDGQLAELDTDQLTSSELVQRHLAGARVVKAFNTIDHARLAGNARPSGAPDRSALPIAGDDQAAKAQVSQLLDLLGYDAVDTGTLSGSWRSEPNTPIYVQPYAPPMPGDPTEPDVQRRYFEAPGIPVSVDRVEELVSAAVRGPAGGFIPTLANG